MRSCGKIVSEVNIVEPIIFNITKNTLEKMNKFYDSQMVPFDETDILLQAKTINCEITVTKDMKARFNGQNAIHEAIHWNKTLAKKMQAAIKSNEIYTYHHIGAAETGSTDFIGPLCVVACYINEEGIDFVKNLHIEDIESLSTEEIIDYAKTIKSHVISSLLILDNSHYNDMINKGFNQANIRARLFNQALVNVLQKAKKSVELKVVEKYISPKTYFNYLKSEVIVVKDLQFEKEAKSQYMAVLAAEIISRYAYIQYFTSMSKSLKFSLLRGTGANVDNIVVEIAKKYGPKILTKVVKTNFSDMKKVNNILNKESL